MAKHTLLKKEIHYTPAAMKSFLDEALNSIFLLKIFVFWEYFSEAHPYFYEPKLCHLHNDHNYEFLILV